MATIIEELHETLLHAQSLIEDLPDLSVERNSPVSDQEEDQPEIIEIFNRLYTLAQSKGYALLQCQDPLSGSQPDAPLVSSQTSAAC